MQGEKLREVGDLFFQASLPAPDYIHKINLMLNLDGF